MSKIIFMMIAVSFCVLFIVIMLFIWAIKGEQFDNDRKFIALDDSVESLNEAALLESRKKRALEKRAQNDTTLK